MTLRCVYFNSKDRGLYVIYILFFVLLRTYRMEIFENSTQKLICVSCHFFFCKFKSVKLVCTIHKEIQGAPSQPIIIPALTFKHLRAASITQSEAATNWLCASDQPIRCRPRNTPKGNIFSMIILVFRVGVVNRLGQSLVLNRNKNGGGRICWRW